MKRFILILNPHGGVKTGRTILKKVQPVFESVGAELNVYETEHAGHAKELTYSLDYTGYDGLCAIGGDGTMHEVVNGMLSRPDQRQLPIGLITGGTGNSFMRDVNCLDPVVAAKRIITGRKRAVDVAKVDANGEILYAFNIVGWGMPTEINRISEKLRWMGGQRYNVASIIEVMKNRQRLATLVVDGNRIVGNFGFILGCNTIHTGKGMKMAPLAQVDDGYIDLIIVHKAGRLKLLNMFPKVFSGAHIGDAAVEYKQVKEFSVIPNEPHELNIDGEAIGSTPIHVVMIPKAIEMLV